MKHFHSPARYTDTRDMIYQISDTPDLVVETDNLEYVKKIVRSHPNCSIRELGTGKVYRPRLVPRETGAEGPPAAARRPPLEEAPTAQPEERAARAAKLLPPHG